MNKLRAPDSFEWSGYTWIPRERWGLFHLEKPWNWYDPSCVKIDSEGKLCLSVKYNPAYFGADDDLVRSDYGVGLISCEQLFTFGHFEIVAKLPKGVGLWPAFWLYPDKSWPPEIDIFEAYSGDNNYKTGWFLKPYAIESCVHSKEGPGLPARRPWTWPFNLDPTDTFYSYSLSWKPTSLVFRINGVTVRTIAHNRILSDLSKYKMQLIINTHIDGNYRNNSEPLTDFEVTSFYYSRYESNSDSIIVP